MKEIKHLSDLTDLTPNELKDVYKKYESSINSLRLTGIGFWVSGLIIGNIGFLYFMKEPLGNYEAWFLMLILISAYYIGDRIAYKKGFLDGYEAGWSEGIKKAIKQERSLSDKDFVTMEEMDRESEYGI